MAISAEDLKRHYRGMSDGELLALDPTELTEVARQVHAEELQRRGLDAEQAPEGEIGDFVEGSAERWLSAGIFRFEDEIHALLPALRHARIQAEIETDPDEVVWMGINRYPAHRILVPEGQVEEARSVIESFANAEELAARNEAVAPPRLVPARYEDGVFKPLEPVEDLAEGTEVEVELPR